MTDNHLEMYDHLLHTNDEELANELYLNHFNEFYIWQQIRILQRASRHHVSEEVGNDHWRIRKVVAQCGSDADRTALMYDPSNNVRACVAEFGTDQQRWLMINDTSNAVRTKIYAHAQDETLREAVINQGRWNKSLSNTISKIKENKQHIILTKNVSFEL